MDARRKEVCDGVFEKIAETRSEAVDAMTRLAQKSGANAGCCCQPYSAPMHGAMNLLVGCPIYIT